MRNVTSLYFNFSVRYSKNALKIHYYYPELKELQNAPLTYSLCFSVMSFRPYVTKRTTDAWCLNSKFFTAKTHTPNPCRYVCTYGKLSFFVEKMADKCKIMHKGCTASDKFALIVVLPKIPQIPHSFFGQSTQIVLNIWDMCEKSPYSASVVRST